MRGRLIFLMFICAVSLSAETAVIRTISISGIKRTREKVVRDILQPIEEGSFYTEETDEIITQKLRAAGIFNPEVLIITEQTENLIDLEIILRDRWTLIPIPIVSLAGGDSWKAGILVIEGNLLGLNKTLGIGSFFGSDGWSLLSFFSTPLFIEKNMTLTTSFSAGLDDTDDLNVDEEIIRDYQSDTLNLGLSLESPLKDHLFLKGSWEYNHSALREDSTEIPDLTSTGFSGEIKWKDLYYDIPYERGVLAKASCTWNFGLGETESYPSAEAAFTGAFPPWRGSGRSHLIRVILRGGWGELPAQKEFRLGGSPGSRILPMNKVPADAYTSSSLSYNLPFWSFPGGTLAAKTFYEAGLFKSDLTEKTIFHGPGAGLELFINDLAIPAVQMNIGWNLETGRYQFSAGIGMGGGNPD